MEQPNLKPLFQAAIEAQAKLDEFQKKRDVWFFVHSYRVTPGINFTVIEGERTTHYDKDGYIYINKAVTKTLADILSATEAEVEELGGKQKWLKMISDGCTKF